MRLEFQQPAQQQQPGADGLPFLGRGPPGHAQQRLALAGGAAATDADVQHKYQVLQAHCAAVGRPCASVLRTYSFVPVLLADSPAALTIKRERVPPQVLAFAGAAALMGTPEQAVERVQALVSAGCQYFNFGVVDPDMLRLLAEPVVPAVLPGASTTRPPGSLSPMLVRPARSSPRAGSCGKSTGDTAR